MLLVLLVDKHVLRYLILHSLQRWEDGLSDKLEYDSAGNIKTQVVRSPFVQVVSEEAIILSKNIYFCYLSFTYFADSTWCYRR